jgi:hypothetical protein
MRINTSRDFRSLWNMAIRFGACLLMLYGHSAKASTISRYPDVLDAQQTSTEAGGNGSVWLPIHCRSHEVLSVGAYRLPIAVKFPRNIHCLKKGLLANGVLLHRHKATVVELFFDDRYEQLLLRWAKDQPKNPPLDMQGCSYTLTHRPFWNYSVYHGAAEWHRGIEINTKLAILSYRWSDIGNQFMHMPDYPDPLNGIPYFVILDGPSSPIRNQRRCLRLLIIVRPISQTATVMLKPEIPSSSRSAGTK